MISCDEDKETNKFTGLWLVKKVKVGKEEMTPNARWMNFKEDSTQISGNGWLQHSYGTWSLKGNRLVVVDENGITDTSEPFKVEIKEHKMLWERKEEGEHVTVYLERINKIPTSEGNKLLGLWGLKSKKVDSISKKVINPTSTLHLRWDNTYVIENSSKKKKYGIYKIHGHKPELQMVNYGDTPKFKFYKFTVEKDKLTLKSTDNKEELSYVRVHQFLQ
ncbi:MULTISPECIES: hypothetical protein [unclassified Tenacibaculum]|uniref:hypothetical protein n=1 Tax=unclassified Tenacibaculum TaxID=2635139 RepID=UPI001F29F395|nr:MULTISPECIES: hypothetical protein [unclassified Tenacibaculum]MCF2873986.1 hypothetical protein [Tenacibaculum sp. Cn5-1]MCF2934567.1 hypothetical protein [Tenacibaculum sp. Cn5-34]MCG7510777.1 hypothetical protein [Tenacibaculum sp. Cn5-46]